MNKPINQLCNNGALVFAILLGIGFFFVPGWFPPLNPGLDANAIAAMYEERRLAIRFGMTIAIFSCGFWWTFSAAIAMQMRRMEGRFPILAYLQMATATSTVIIVMFSCYFMLAAAYRPGLQPETIQLMTDLGWLMNIGAYPAGLFQNLAIGLCILSAPAAKAVYPRWLGFANLWIAILYLPGAILPFFHGGPFAWNGVIGFWLVAFFFFNWIFLMWWYTRKAIKTYPADWESAE